MFASPSPCGVRGFSGPDYVQLFNTQHFTVVMVPNAYQTFLVGNSHEQISSRRSVDAACAQEEHCVADSTVLEALRVCAAAGPALAGIFPTTRVNECAEFQKMFVGLRICDGFESNRDRC